MIKIKISSVLSIVAAVSAGALLFWTSQNVQHAERRLKGLHKDVRAEQQSIRVLNAEWYYLNRPDRLELLATEYLGLSSAAAFSVSGDVSALPDPFIPAIPQSKPSIKAQSIVYKSQQEDVDKKSFVQPKPIKKQGGFDDLLKTLSEGGGDQ